MKNLLFILIVLSITSCGQRSNRGTATPEQNTEISDNTNNRNANELSPVFDINSILVSSEDIGSFPYLSAPDGYEYSREHNRKYEEKFFFYNDSLMMTVGGKYYHAMIVPKNGEEFSGTYIVKNYELAIEKIGGIQIYSGSIVKKASELLRESDVPYAKDMYNPYPYNYKQFIVKTPEGNVWFELCYGLNMNGVDFTVIHEGDVEETVKIVKADELRSAIDKDGKAILYINFDTDKATLKPDGIQAVGEIAKLMKSDPSLKLSVEGHTDNTGSIEHNKKLSLERAESVVDKLKELDVDSERLKVNGYGSEKPLVDNKTEKDKAKNRRVEIVKF